MKARSPISDGSYKQLFEEAIRKRDDGRLEEAEKLLSELEEQQPRNLAATLVRAGICFEMGQFDLARVLFKKVVESQPRSELASRGLFHSLWRLGRHDDAFTEMRRYLLHSDSEEYRRLIDDIINEAGSNEVKEGYGPIDSSGNTNT